MYNTERELRNIENNKLQFQYRASVSKWIQVRDQVAWSCLIKEKNQGGLGMVDPVHQSKALLGKLVV